jgi:hypothetical protein
MRIESEYGYGRHVSNPFILSFLNIGEKESAISRQIFFAARHVKIRVR